MDIAAEDLEIPVLEEGVKVLSISSVSGQGLKELKDELWREVSGRTRAAELLDESHRVNMQQAELYCQVCASCRCPGNFRHYCGVCPPGNNA